MLSDSPSTQESKMIKEVLPLIKEVMDYLTSENFWFYDLPSIKPDFTPSHSDFRFLAIFFECAGKLHVISLKKE